MLVHNIFRRNAHTTIQTRHDALASSGPHSNGYSLIRKIIEVSGGDLNEDCDGKSLGDALLAPTQIYVSALKDILSNYDIHALAHITGGCLRMAHHHCVQFIMIPCKADSCKEGSQISIKTNISSCYGYFQPPAVGHMY